MNQDGALGHEPMQTPRQPAPAAGLLRRAHSLIDSNRFIKLENIETFSPIET